MKINEYIDNPDIYGQYPIVEISGKGQYIKKIYDELQSRFQGNGFKFAIIFDCSKDEYQEPEDMTLVYTLDCVLDEVIHYCGVEAVMRRCKEFGGGA